MKEVRLTMFQTSTSTRQKGRSRAESETRFLAWAPHWDLLPLPSHWKNGLKQSKIPLLVHCSVIASLPCGWVNEWLSYVFSIPDIFLSANGGCSCYYPLGDWWNVLWRPKARDHQCAVAWYQRAKPWSRQACSSGLGSALVPPSSPPL